MTDETREVVVSPGTLAGLAGGRAGQVEGLEEYSDRDLGVRPPEIRIVHAVKRAEDPARPGDLRIMGKPYRSLEVYFLKAQKSRWLTEGEERNTRITCASLDRVQPMEGLPQQKAVFCADCEYSLWSDHPENPERRVPPPCAEAEVLLGVWMHPETGKPHPFWFACQKSASMPAKEFLKEVRRLGGSPDPNERIGSMRELKVRLTTEQGRPAGVRRVSNDGVIWYVPIFTIVAETPQTRAERRAELAGLYNAAREIVFVPEIRLDPITGEEGDVTVVPEGGNGGVPPF